MTIQIEKLPSTPAEAAALGLTHYFTGKPCNRGHIARRYASTRQCVDCQLMHLKAVPAEEKRRIAREYEKTGKPRQRRLSKEGRAAASARHKRFKANNPGYASKYQQQRVATEPVYHVKKNLRNRLRKFVLGQEKGSISEVIGCDWSFLINHIESQFQPGMSWDNYGVHGWHIDHIRPCADWDDLTALDQQKECFHWSNLRPLWAVENLRKGSRPEAA